MSVRRFRPALAVAAMLAGLGALVLAPLMVAAQAAPAAPLPTRTPATDFARSTCTVTTTTHVQPGAFLVGEAIAMTRTVQADCPPPPPKPLHIVLVLDGTARMAGEPHAEMLRAMRQFVPMLAPLLETNGRVAVLSIDTRARQLCPFTHRIHQVQGCVGSVGAVGGGTVADGLRLAMRTMVVGKRLWPGREADDIVPVVILVSPMASGQHCAEAQRASRELSGQGTLVVAVDVGGNRGDARCMRRLATSPRYYFEARAIFKLKGVLEQIRKTFVNIILRQLVVTETLPAHTSLVAGSETPPLSALSSDFRGLVWQSISPTSNRYTFTYKVRPSAPGYQPLSEGSGGWINDGRGQRVPFAFEQPFVSVLRPDYASNPIDSGRMVVRQSVPDD